MRQHLVLAGVLGSMLAGAGCGGGGYSSSPSPTPTPSPTPAAITVNIAGDKGSQSFSPDPATPGAALTVAWKNSDGVVHRIVANDNSFDTGNIGASGTSTTITVPAAGIHYHCAIHPGMIGAVAGSSGTTPPCTGLYCGNQ